MGGAVTWATRAGVHIDRAASAWLIRRFVDEADLEDDRYDAPEAPGFDVMLRGLSMTQDDEQVLALTGPIFDGLYAWFHRAYVQGREAPE